MQLCKLGGLIVDIYQINRENPLRGTQERIPVMENKRMFTVVSFIKEL